MKSVTTALGLFTLLLFSSSHAQQTWERTYGGTGNDFGQSGQQTTDGGYIVAGFTSSFGAGSWDVYLIKTNASGDTLWTRTYGGTDEDVGYSVQQTSEGGYIIAGYSGYFGPRKNDVYLIKTNASGGTLWTRTYGGTNYDYGESVQQTTDGGYIIAGFTYSFGAGGYDVYLIKTDASGDTLWTRTYGGAGDDQGESVQQTSDGGYIVAGITRTMGYQEVWLIKTNASGDTLWTRTYGPHDDWAQSVQQTSDGGYIIAGSAYINNNEHVCLIKTNASGDSIWTRTYGGTGSDVGLSVKQTTDGGYIITGRTSSFGAGGYDVYLIKTNGSGDTLWTRTYGGTGDDWGYSIQQTTDGGYIIAGYTSSFGAGGYDVYLIKTDANGNVGVEEDKGRGQKLEVRINPRPNPFVSFATVPGHEGERFKLYDVMGRMVGTYKGDRIGEGLAAGVYFLRSSDNNDKPLRIVKVR
jgi:hypothetical protein